MVICSRQNVQRHHAAPAQCINLTSIALKNDEVSPTSLEELSNTPDSVKNYDFSGWTDTMESWANIRWVRANAPGPLSLSFLIHNRKKRPCCTDQHIENNIH